MKLNQVTVPTQNVNLSIEFYQKLGLKLIVQSPHYARFLCPEGGSTFSIHLNENSKLKNEGTVVYFECENLDKTYEELLDKGIQFTQSPKDQNWLWREAHLSDPDGNAIILFYAGEHRINPPWRI